MAAPAIGQRRRWAPPPTAKLDAGHPLAPACGWIPSMGLRTVHGDPVTQSVSAGCGPDVTGIGQGFRYNATSADYHGWPNRLNGPLTDVTFAIWGIFPSAPGAYSAVLYTRGAGIAATGVGSTSGAVSGATWNSANYDFSGPSFTGRDQFLVVVNRAASVEFWIDGILRATNTTANSALDFSSLSGAVAWQTADPLVGNRQLGGSRALHLIWGRALTGAEIGSLYKEPFQFMRR